MVAPLAKPILSMSPTFEPNLTVGHQDPSYGDAIAFRPLPSLRCRHRLRRYPIHGSCPAGGICSVSSAAEPGGFAERARSRTAAVEPRDQGTGCAGTLGSKRQACC